MTSTVVVVTMGVVVTVGVVATTAGAARVGATGVLTDTVRLLDFLVVAAFFVDFLVTTLTGLRVAFAFAFDAAAVWPFSDAAVRVPTAKRTCAPDGNADAPRTNVAATTATSDRLGIPINVTPAAL